MTDLLIDPAPRTKNIALLDIDGCVINIDARLPYLLAGDYDGFLKNWKTDRAIPQGLYFYKTLIRDPEIRVIFNTARPEHDRLITTTQLTHVLGSSDFELWMCPDEDHNRIDDVELKLNAIYRNNVDPTDIFIAFDDRNCIVEAYRKLGICSYQTDTGY